MKVLRVAVVLAVALLAGYAGQAAAWATGGHLNVPFGGVCDGGNRWEVVVYADLVIQAPASVEWSDDQADWSSPTALAPGYGPDGTFLGADLRFDWVLSQNVWIRLYARGLPSVSIPRPAAGGGCAVPATPTPTVAATPAPTPTPTTAPTPVPVSETPAPASTPVPVSSTPVPVRTSTPKAVATPKVSADPSQVATATPTATATATLAVADVAAVSSTDPQPEAAAAPQPDQAPQDGLPSWLILVGALVGVLALGVGVIWVMRGER